MHSFVPKTLFVTLWATLASVTLAQYNPDNDVYVRINNPVVEEIAETAELGELGDDLFEAQEGAHELVKESTGEEVEHYYIHICSGDECVPVDPLRFSN